MKLADPATYSICPTAHGHHQVVHILVYCHPAPLMYKKYRPTKYCVFLKILTNFPFPFCLAGFSFLPKGMGDVFVDYSGYNKEYSETVLTKLFCFVILKNSHSNFIIFLQFSDL